MLKWPRLRRGKWPTAVPSWLPTHGCAARNMQRETRGHFNNGDTTTAVKPMLNHIACGALACAHAAETNTPAMDGHDAAAQAYFREGMGLVRAADYNGAIKMFRSALKQNPRMAEACLNLGACFERLQQFDKGTPFYDQALMIEPKNARFHYLYGTALARNGQAEKGVALLERAAYLAPDDADCLYNLGVGYVVLTQYAMAATCFEQVSGIASNNSVVWYNLGLARLRLNQTDEAERAWGKVELDAPVAPEAHCHLALAAAARQDASGAFDHVKMALALNPGLAEARRLLAELYLHAGDCCRAASELEQVYLANPTDEAGTEIADVYCAWAQQAGASNDYHRALDRYRQAVRFTPEDARVQLGIARSALAMGETDTARDALSRARQHARTREDEDAIQSLATRMNVGATATNAPAESMVTNAAARAPQQ